MIDDREIQRRLKISRTLRGRIPWNKGLKNWRVISDETRRKIGDAHRGKKVVVSFETKRKISQALKGRIPKNLLFLHSLPRTEEWKNNISIGNTGKILTLDTRDKISRAKRKPSTPLYRAVRECYKSRDWRKAIFKRDNFTCVLCRKIGNTINADHFPRRFVDILRDNKIDTMEKALENTELWDINKGRTLCKSCHEKTETWGNKFKLLEVKK